MSLDARRASRDAAAALALAHATLALARTALAVASPKLCGSLYQELFQQELPDSLYSKWLGVPRSREAHTACGSYEHRLALGPCVSALPVPEMF